MRNRLHLIAVLWVGGVALLFIGAFWTMGTLARVDRISERLERKRGYMEELRQLEEKISPYLASKKAMSALAANKPVPLETIVEKVVEGDEDPQVRSVSRTKQEGWLLIRKEVTLNTLPVSEIFDMIKAAEGSGYSGKDLQRPAWLLVKCTISSLSGRPGWGRAALVFETLSK